MRFYCEVLASAMISGLLISGCGPAGPVLAPVHGFVTLDGEPLSEAIVIFQPMGKKAFPSTAETAADGTYELMFGRNRKGAMLGKHLVRITTEKLITDESGKETTVPGKVPAHYDKQPKLEFEVEPGENIFEILLDSKSAPPALPRKS